jgi:hypothetical protein
MEQGVLTGKDRNNLIELHIGKTFINGIGVDIAFHGFCGYQFHGNGTEGSNFHI